MKFILGRAKNLEMNKSQALPVGTRKKYGEYWYVKGSDGKWWYDGTDSSSTPPPTADQNQKAAQALRGIEGSTDRGYMEQLQRVAKGTADQIIQETTRRDRLVGGQDVRYYGHYHGKYKGQKGSVVAIGNDGDAMIQMPDKEVITVYWKSVKPEGTINPHSIYDGLTDSNIFTIKGKMAESVGRVLDKKIGNSSVTYRELCERIRSKGFTAIIVGGTVRDFLQGEDSKDVDMIVNCSDMELQHIIRGINPRWSMSWKLNSRLGLVTIVDGKDEVDVTPFHFHSDLIPSWTVKGWKLKGDAESRDFTINSLQLDPLTGRVVDATGKGLEHLRTKTLEFCNPSMLPFAPRYTLRAFKFISRGYKPTPETEKHIRGNLQYVWRLEPDQKMRFLENQIVGKDGAAGLKKFKENFLKYDDGGAIWKSHFETIYNTMLRKLGGK